MPPSSDRHAGRADAHARAERIAEAVDTTWHRSAAAVSRIEIPLSVVAGFALLKIEETIPEHSSPSVTARLQNLSDDDVISVLRELWVAYLNDRPDLIARAYPLCSWLFFGAIDRTVREAAVATARASLEADQLQLTGTDLRHTVDLLGVVLTHLRSDSARKGKGQFFTPADLADLMAHMVAADGRTGERTAAQTADRTVDRVAVHEPAAGTGGMLRAMAQMMRQTGRDPATVSWSAVDVDELAIACLAVNAHLWGLGPDVLLGVGDALVDDWRVRAEAERAECVQLALQIRRHKAALQLLNSIERLIDQQPADIDGATADGQYE